MILHSTVQEAVAVPGEGKIFFRDASSIMRGQRERDLVVANKDVGVMLHFLSAFGNARYECHSLDKVLKAERTLNRVASLGPIRPLSESRFDLLFREFLDTVHALVYPLIPAR